MKYPHHHEQHFFLGCTPLSSLPSCLPQMQSNFSRFSLTGSSGGVLTWGSPLALLLTEDFLPSLRSSISSFFCSQMPWMRAVKACSTLSPLSAEVSMQTTLFLLRESHPSTFSRLTSRLCPRSDLLPTSSTTVSFFVFSSASSIHLPTLSKDRELVRSKATMAPAAPLQQALVTDLNRSCPAVSQIWHRMSFSPSLRDLEENSTPTVGFSSSKNTPSTNWETRLVLPTPESPITTILNKQLNSQFMQQISQPGQRVDWDATYVQSAYDDGQEVISQLASQPLSLKQCCRLCLQEGSDSYCRQDYQPFTGELLAVRMGCRGWYFGSLRSYSSLARLIFQMLVSPSASFMFSLWITMDYWITWGAGGPKMAWWV